jgi:hypothetical protein
VCNDAVSYCEVRQLNWNNRTHSLKYIVTSLFSVVKLLDLTLCTHTDISATPGYTPEKFLLYVSLVYLNCYARIFHKIALCKRVELHRIPGLSYGAYLGEILRTFLQTYLISNPGIRVAWFFEWTSAMLQFCEVSLLGILQLHFIYLNIRYQITVYLTKMQYQ